MKTSVHTGLRLAPEVLQTWLDRLDRDAGPPRGLDVRLSPRFAYRSLGLTLEISETGAPATRHEAAGRNLSREGLGVLASRFVYPRTLCRITLRDAQARSRTVSGQVVRCRYVVGSGSLYDLGIALDRPIEVVAFTAEV
jgi:hypothetical protein